MTLLRTFAVLVLLTSTPLLAEVPMPFAGPENNGLRLRLLATNSARPEKKHRVRLEVINVGKTPVTLVAQFAYENERDYAEYLHDAVRFTSLPEVLPTPFSTKGSPRQSPQPKTTIAPGRSLLTEWNTRNNLIGGGSESHEDLTFERKGMFLVRAHLLLRTADAKYIKLWSNEQPLIVGGSRRAPKGCAASVTWISEDLKSISLDVGIVEGIVPGDRFEIGHGKTTLWRVRISQVQERRSTATVVKTVGREPMPRVGSKARFVRVAPSQ